DLFERRVLPHNAAAQSSIKLSSIVAATVRIEHCCEIRSHKIVVQLPGLCPFRKAVFPALPRLFPNFAGLIPSFLPTLWKRQTVSLSQLQLPETFVVRLPLK